MTVTYTKNNKANVSTTRGVKGGYLFRAPIGTAGAPTKADPFSFASGDAIPDGWVCLGYIPEDGFTEAYETEDGEAIRDVNLENLDETEGSTTETLHFALMEIKKDALAVHFGSANVSDANGILEVKHNWANASEHYQYVFRLLLKNDRKQTKYIPDAKVTARDEFTGNKTTAAQYGVTLTYNNDADGSGCYDWYESTETEAPSNG